MLSLTPRIATLYALAVAAAWAQSDTGKATLEGRVLDPSGNTIPNVEVSARATQTGLQRKVSTDAEGKFRLAALQVGSYDLEATAAGFAAARLDRVELLVGQTRSVNIVLTLASVSTQVNVETGAEIVNQADTITALSSTRERSRICRFADGTLRISFN